MTTTHAPTLRSLYRRLLRELPVHQPSQTILSHPSPLLRRIRTSFTSPSTSSPSPASSADTTPRIQATEQFVQYQHAQRMYATLVERYNPGMNMNEEERVRLTARRVGMDLPAEFLASKSGGAGDGGQGEK
ncbi:hypothetical protein W97_06223 [Coniosporium apollinis CBS 100218]|uniref:Uncharacterized protein n=1 Tax=Coniosporium apollinis (strain CBS 100218) TaxID=1168221 RepID=R7YYS5_CONA1|nr:uncharacterized protein W97_06223 [Coniosporium apollinis CBS 100218]EON66821.1 hypothetical protein W97_06223 [Coniosporium apollinis CBS 100218]